MRVRVRFRMNVVTGEVQEFLIEDVSTEPVAEHDAEHDRIARKIGGIVVRRPAPEQIMLTGSAAPSPLMYRPDDEEPQVRRETTAE